MKPERNDSNLTNVVLSSTRARLPPPQQQYSTPLSPPQQSCSSDIPHQQAIPYKAHKSNISWQRRVFYTVVTLPRFPNPDTMAAAAAMPTSPCRGPNNSADQHIQIGTVGPNPNPAIKSPLYLAHGGPANVVTNSPVIITRQLAEKNAARCR